MRTPRLEPYPPRLNPSVTVPLLVLVAFAMLVLLVIALARAT